MGAEEIAALSPAANDEPSPDETRPHREDAPPPAAPVPVIPLPALPDPAPVAMDRLEPLAPLKVELLDDAACHPLYRGVFGTEP